MILGTKNRWEYAEIGWHSTEVLQKSIAVISDLQNWNFIFLEKYYD